VRVAPRRVEVVRVAEGADGVEAVRRLDDLATALAVGEAGPLAVRRARRLQAADPAGHAVARLVAHDGVHAEGEGALALGRDEPRPRAVGGRLDPPEGAGRAAAAAVAAGALPAAGRRGR